MLVTNENRHIAGIELSIFGVTDISIEANVDALINALESQPIFTPDSASGDERGSQPYDRNWFRERAINRRPELSRYIHFKRTKVAKYSGYCVVGKQPYLGITVDSKLVIKNYSILAEWSQSIVEALSPDYAVLSIFANSEDAPWTTKLDEKICRFRFSSIAYPGNYYRKGPPGLGTVTWLGEHFVNQIGLNNLKGGSNFHCLDQEWGGKKIVFGDIDKPWNQDVSIFLEGWRNATEELAQHKIFATFNLTEKYGLLSEKGERCEIGGTIKN